MANEDRQMEMALLPPRVEDQELSPRTEPGRGLSVGDFARESFESAVERFRSAGNVDVDPEDPALYNAYRRSIDYLGDMALGGLDLSDAAFRAAVGITAQALPEGQERRFARDLAAMPEAFLGFSPGRVAQVTDQVLEGAGQAARRLAGGRTPRETTSQMPEDFEGEVLPDTPRPAVQTPPRSKINPLLLNRDLPPEEDAILTFYSPLRSAINNMPIAREGSTGETIMAYLNKRAPNVSSSEIEFSGLNLDPQRRYTREEVLGELRRDTSDFRADIITGPETLYRKEQRQNITNPDNEYFEITLDNPNFESGVTHFSRNTFAHSRSSLRSGSEEGEDFLLIEELQSDPLQNIGDVVQRDGEDLMGGIDAIFDQVKEDLDFQDVSVSNLVLDVSLNDMLLQNRSLEDLKVIYREIYDLSVEGATREAIHLDALRKSTPDLLSDEAEEILRSALSRAGQVNTESSLSVSDLPFSGNTQYVKNLLLANIAVARNNGVNRIVIPPIEEIARLRANTGDFPDMESAVRALRPTYVDAVRKAVNILNNEANGTIRVGTQTLEYPTAVAGQTTRRATGTLLDISDFEFDPRTQAARFAEGGEVTMDKQMSLFEEGGLMDDGADRDPVSGNEVPSGSMSEEVRDDVPAMLSEGEYVVPADVVRYYGLSFFENLRSQAKDGLQNMEEDGRIGGDPVRMSSTEFGIPPNRSQDMKMNDLTEEEVRMLMEVSGMNQGGMVQGYQVGGMTTQPYQSPYLPNQFPQYSTPGMSVFGTPLPTYGPTTTDASQTEVTLYSPQGVPFTLRLPRDQQRYNDLLALGYTTEMPQTVQVQQPPGVQQPEDDRRPEQERAEREERAARTREALLQDPIQFGIDAVSGDGNAQMRGARLGLLAGPIGLILGGLGGAALTASNVANARAASRFAQQQGYDTTDLDSKIEEFVTGLSGPAKAMSEQVTGNRRFDNWMNGFWDTGGLGIDDFAPGDAGAAAYKQYTEAASTQQEYIHQDEGSGSSGLGFTKAPERDWWDTGVSLLPPTGGTSNMDASSLLPPTTTTTSSSRGTSSDSGTSGGGRYSGSRSQLEAAGYTVSSDGNSVYNENGQVAGENWSGSRTVTDISGVGAEPEPSSGGGGGCCFILLEARYGDGTMDAVVRRYRDEYMTDRNRRGYYKLAEVLVPLMRKSKTVKWLVTKTMADPLVSYGKYYYGENKHGVIFKPVKSFWMKVFDVLGGNTEFIRENGEVV